MRFIRQNSETNLNDLRIKLESYPQAYKLKTPNGQRIENLGVFLSIFVFFCQNYAFHFRKMAVFGFKGLKHLLGYLENFSIEYRFCSVKCACVEGVTNALRQKLKFRTKIDMFPILFVFRGRTSFIFIHLFRSYTAMGNFWPIFFSANHLSCFPVSRVNQVIGKINPLTNHFGSVSTSINTCLGNTSNVNSWNFLAKGIKGN